MCGTIPTTRQASAGSHAARPPGAAVRVLPLTDSQGNDVTSRWPLMSFLELGALPGAVPCARLHARQVLREWGLETSAGTAELLVTNAMHITRAAAADKPVRLWLVSDKTQVLIWVWDASPLPPARADADGDAEHGRGLMLVQALSTRWGWDFPHGLGGKIVWAQLLSVNGLSHGDRCTLWRERLLQARAPAGLETLHRVWVALERLWVSNVSA